MSNKSLATKKNGNTDNKGGKPNLKVVHIIRGKEVPREELHNYNLCDIPAVNDLIWSILREQQALLEKEKEATSNK